MSKLSKLFAVVTIIASFSALADQQIVPVQAQPGDSFGPWVGQRTECSGWVPGTGEKSIGTIFTQYQMCNELQARTLVQASGGVDSTSLQNQQYRVVRATSRRYSIGLHMSLASH